MNNGDACMIGIEPEQEQFSPEGADIINYSEYILGQASSPPHHQAHKKGSQLMMVPEEQGDLPADPFRDEYDGQSSSDDDGDRRED